MTLVKVAFILALAVVWFAGLLYQFPSWDLISRYVGLSLLMTAVAALR
jgi:hypothetical protein